MESKKVELSTLGIGEYFKHGGVTFIVTNTDKKIYTCTIAAQSSGVWLSSQAHVTPVRAVIPFGRFGDMLIGVLIGVLISALGTLILLY